MISQLIKGSKEKFFIKPNFRRKYQTSSGQKFIGKKLTINFCPEEDVWYFRRKFGLIKNFSLLPFINLLINMIPRILIFATINFRYSFTQVFACVLMCAGLMWFTLADSTIQPHFSIEGDGLIFLILYFNILILIFLIFLDSQT